MAVPWALPASFSKQFRLDVLARYIGPRNAIVAEQSVVRLEQDTECGMTRRMLSSTENGSTADAANFT